MTASPIPDFCAIDFGTSNSAIAVPDARGAMRLVPLEDGAVTMPTATFYLAEGPGLQDLPRLHGRAALAAYVEGSEGRLMRSMKSALGTGLMTQQTDIGAGRAIGFAEVISGYLRHLRRAAELHTGVAPRRAVIGRPVHFVDEDAQRDAQAQAALEQAAREAGFEEVAFQFEPLAAAFDHESRIEVEQRVLIADIGGGTSDFSIVRLGPERAKKAERVSDVLANDGVRIGGIDFDRHLSLGTVMPLLGFRSKLARGELDVPSIYYHDLATWSAINRLYEPRVHRELVDLEKRAAEPELIHRLMRVVDDERGHTLAIDVEAAKIAVAEHGAVTVPFDWLERGLSTDIDHSELVRHTGELASRIGARVDACLEMAGVAATDIDALFLTGGSTRLEHVRTAILASVPEARVVTGNVFGSVGTGLAVEAARRYG